MPAGSGGGISLYREVSISGNGSVNVSLDENSVYLAMLITSSGGAPWEVSGFKAGNIPYASGTSKVALFSLIAITGVKEDIINIEKVSAGTFKLTNKAGSNYTIMFYKLG